LVCAKHNIDAHNAVGMQRNPGCPGRHPRADEPRRAAANDAGIPAKPRGAAKSGASSSVAQEPPDAVTKPGGATRSAGSGVVECASSSNDIAVSNAPFSERAAAHGGIEFANGNRSRAPQPVRALSPKSRAIGEGNPGNRVTKR